MNLKKNHISTECDYSFEMLYHAAFGKNIPQDEKLKLQVLNQDRINSLVKAWTKKAGWRTEERTGSDNKIYLAFSPKGNGSL